MDKLFNFIKKTEMDIKFKGAGEGHVLSKENEKTQKDVSESSKKVNESSKSTQPSSSSNTNVNPQSREATSKASQAALDRFEKNNQKSTKVQKPKKLLSESFPTEQRKIQKTEEIESSSSSSSSKESNLPKNEHEGNLYLAVKYLKEYGDELQDGALNNCIDILCKYLDNIVLNVTEQKYRKIKMSNKVFSEKVKNVPGAIEVLKVAGFIEITEEIDGNQENFLQYPFEASVEILSNLKDALQDQSIDREIKVFLLGKTPSTTTSLPDSFYELSAAEIKLEAEKKKQQTEEMLTLRTKAMREQSEIKFRGKFKYSNIRIRFPNGITIQGRFGIKEPSSEIFEFVKFCMETPTNNFKLLTPPEMKELQNSSQTLSELGLVPSALLNLRTDNEIKISESLMAFAQPMS